MHFVPSLHLQGKDLCVHALIVLGHNNGSCVDPGVEEDYLGTPESSEFEASGKSSSKTLSYDYGWNLLLCPTKSMNQLRDS